MTSIPERNFPYQFLIPGKKNLVLLRPLSYVICHIVLVVYLNCSFDFVKDKDFTIDHYGFGQVSSRLSQPSQCLRDLETSFVARTLLEARLG